MKPVTTVLAIAAAATLATTGALTIGPALAGTPASATAGTTPRASITETLPAGQTQPDWHDIVTSNPRLKQLWAHSPSMNRDIPLFVIAPKDTSQPRPIIYLLNGGDGGEGTANWVYQTDVVDFYRDKNVWVVIPMAGQFSYYTDWVSDNATLGGKQTWETFLTKELPEPLESYLGASDKRGIIGMSMSATTTLLYAEHHPGFYDAIGSFSGCAETSRGFPLEYLRLTLDRGSATPEQMWGPIGGKTFLYNDALLNAERLRGQKMYISNGTGLAGRYDLWSTKYTQGDPGAIFVRVVNGGIIEAATNKCTHDLKARLDEANIPADWNLRPVGTHSWGWWQQDLVDSWPTFATAFNMDPGQPAPQAEEKPITPEEITQILGASQGAVDPEHPREIVLAPADGGPATVQQMQEEKRAAEAKKARMAPAAVPPEQPPATTSEKAPEPAAAPPAPADVPAPKPTVAPTSVTPTAQPPRAVPAAEPVGTERHIPVPAIPTPASTVLE